MESYNDGIVKIYRTKNVSEPGRRPVEKLVFLMQLRFRERTVGNTKYNLAKQTGVEVVRLVRCPRLRNVSSHDFAAIKDFESGAIQHYEIDQIQYPENVFPKSMDLSLVKTDWTGEDNV